MRDCRGYNDYAYYGYDASNTRTYKLRMWNHAQWSNGMPDELDLRAYQAVFYPNAYLTFNANGEYTKHYYNGSERICSRLGDNVKPIAATGNGRLAYRTELADWLFRSELQELVSIYGYNAGTPATGVNVLISTGSPNDIFYYHTNHLGSTAYVTDQSQNITQGFLYAPFGEITTEYNAGFANGVIPKYTFNAKELDEETGMYYYEARYYNPPTFISRDPLFEQKPWLSPYHYCSNNPTNKVDPSGMFDDDIYVNTQTKQVSIIETDDSYDRIIVDGEHIGNRAKGEETKERVEGGYSVNTVSIKYENSSMRKLSDYSTAAVIDAMNAIGDNSVTITSTTRSPQDQARIMYNNVKNKGMAKELSYYKTPGQAVIKQYPNGQQAMLKEILNQGPQNVSKHCADPNVMNVFDIAPSSVLNKTGFHTALNSDIRVSKLLSPINSNESAFHIEIPQQKK